MILSLIINDNCYQGEAIGNRGQQKSSIVKPQEVSEKKFNRTAENF